MSSYGQNVGGVTPRSTGDQVVRIELEKSNNFGIVRVPEVDRVAETDCENVGSRPVDQIEVEVVVECRSVEDFGRDFADFPIFFGRSGQVLFRNVE